MFQNFALTQLLLSARCWSLVLFYAECGVDGVQLKQLDFERYLLLLFLLFLLRLSTVQLVCLESVFFVWLRTYYVVLLQRLLFYWRLVVCSQHFQGCEACDYDDCVVYAAHHYHGYSGFYPLPVF